jgi:predicted alpha/beta-hydrolase family hydrolase
MEPTPCEKCEVDVKPDFDLSVDGPKDANQTVALAHGAGAGMDTPFMNAFAKALAQSGFRVVRFEFPYMRSYRQTGQRRPPDREPVLRETWLRVVERLGSEGLVIGGKSMGGRMASLVADEAGVDGLVCLGYPFHPVGKSDRLRVEHLQGIRTPTLILQGERDPFGSRKEVDGYQLSSAIRVQWIEDGDHNLKPRKTSGRTEQQNWEAAIGEIVVFIESVRAGRAGR